MVKVFLTHSPEALKAYYGNRALSALRTLGDVTVNDQERELSIDELIEAIRGHQIVISYRRTPGDAKLFRSNADLIAFVRCAVDIRNIDVEAASEYGVLVTQASAGFMTAVAEWTIGAMIDLARQITFCTESYHQGRLPTAQPALQLKGSTLGILGYGRIGQTLAEMALALGMRVLVCDPYKDVHQDQIEQKTMPALLKEADFVVCLVVANEQAEELISANAFGQMKRGAFFINASRGNLVDDAALIEALDSGHLAGCAVDVGRSPDQMPTPDVARHPKVIATPHSASLTLSSMEHQSLETVRQVAEIIQGRAPSGSVNADKAARLNRFRLR